MKNIRIVVPMFVWSLAFSIGAWLFFYVTPGIEARLFPVLTEQRVEVRQTGRSIGLVCWTWHWTKARHAWPLIVAWTVKVDGTAVEFQAVARRQPENAVIRDPQPAALGPSKTELCATIPPSIDRERDLTIHGVINYRVPHGLWTLWYALPPVRVPPLEGPAQATR